MASIEKPNILLISLASRDSFNYNYSPIITTLSKVAHVLRANTAPDALRVIARTTLKAIFITDEVLAVPNPGTQRVLRMIQLYIETGGLAIVGLHFTNFTKRDQFAAFFRSFGLPWERGDYYRATFKSNPFAVLPQSAVPSSLPEPYSMTVIDVKNARLQERLFVPIDGAVTLNHACLSLPVDSAQAAVTAASIGRGWLVYCGDVNREDGSIQLMLALCGLRKSTVS